MNVCESFPLEIAETFGGSGSHGSACVSPVARGGVAGADFEGGQRVR